MKITLAQIKLKTGDFEFNFENINEILKRVQNDSCSDLIIFPQANIEDLGGKDLVLDEKCRTCQIFIKRLPTKIFLKIF